MILLQNLWVVYPELTHEFKDFRTPWPILRIPGPAFLNQVPVIVKDVAGTHRSNSSRQLNDDLR
jgi:hypothetical protein